jgi:hypothetical protein
LQINGTWNTAFAYNCWSKFGFNNENLMFWICLFKISCELIKVQLKF